MKHSREFFLPARARATCVFEACSAADVATVNPRAEVPFTEVVEVVDLRLARPLSGAGPANSRRVSC